MIERKFVMSMGPLLSALAASGLVVGSAAFAKPGAGACAKLLSATFPNTTISSAKEVAASDSAKTPAYCEVMGVVSPVKDSHIGVVYRLPDSWNGKLLGLGGGGWAGNVKIEPAEPGLAKGYATAQTDGGHPSPSLWDTSWAASPAAAEDFAHRAIHLMTTTGKAVVAKYYDQPQEQAYFQGCSTGGRQGLMEVQRYPDDYNGVISGAPVYSLATQTTGLLRSLAFASPGASMTSAQLSRLSEAALAACDDQDGLKDGIITDPRACNFDPAVIQCKAGEPGESCLSPAQVAAVRAVYAGVKAQGGQFASYPLSRGSELAWDRFIATDKPADGAALATSAAGAGLGGLRAALFGKADFDLTRFSADRDYKPLRTSAFAKLYEAKDPNIVAFVSKGGKLILWHGFEDPGPSPLATIDYYKDVQRVTGSKAGPLDAGVRFFIAPGVYHCRGGPGADTFDTLGALDKWVQKGHAPETLLATRQDGKLSRPLCRYPALPRYKGAGDPNSADSFACKG